MSLAHVFEEIYTRQTWKTGSGPGSVPSNTIAYRCFLEQFIRLNNILKVTDLGCGDWQFSRYINWSGLQYTGFDVVQRIVGENTNKFGSVDIRFEVFTDIESLPGGDLLLAKEVLQHLPNAMVLNYLAVIRRKYRMSLVTNTVGPRGYSNDDIVIGAVRSLRLDEPPFDCPGATVFAYEFMADGVWYHNETFLIMGY